MASEERATKVYIQWMSQPGRTPRDLIEGISEAIRAAEAEAVAAEREARPNLLQEDEIVTIVNRKVAEGWAQFSDGKPPKVLAPQVRHAMAAWAAIRAKGGGDDNTD